MNSETTLDPRRGSQATIWSLSAVALIVQIALIWTPTYFPSVDGPAHVHLAHGFLESLLGNPHYDQVFLLNEQFNPNIASQALLVLLTSIAPPFVAEKLWVTLYLICFAAAGAYALTRIHRSGICLLPWLVFCSLSFPLAFGFYNFALSSVIFLAWIGYWWQHRLDFSVRIVLGHTLLAILAYCTHIFAFIVSAAAIGVLGATCILLLLDSRRLDGGGFRGAWPILRRSLATHTLPPLIGSLPVLALTLAYLFTRFESGTRRGAASIGSIDTSRVVELLSASSFSPYSQQESLAAICMTAGLGIAFAYLVRKGIPRNSTPFVFLFLTFLALYLFMPDQWIVRWMPQRFQPLVFMALILLLSAMLVMASRRWLVLVSCGGLSLVVLSALFRFEVFRDLDELQLEHASLASHIAPNSSLISLRLHSRRNGEPFPAKVDVLIQAGSRVATLSSSVDLKNFQGQSSGHPIQFAAGIGATKSLGGESAVTALPARVDLMRHEITGGRRIDYVLIYGYRDSVLNRRALLELDAQLDRGYRLVRVSEPTGLARLYVRTAADSRGVAGQR